MSQFLGPILVLLFVFSQAFRDVYFGNVFQDLDFFAVIFLAFLAATLFFGAYACLRARHELLILRAHLPAVFAMNVTTALAWTCYFFALTHLEPSVVNTVHSGMAPLTVIVLSAFGVKLAGGAAVGRLEYLCYAGVAFSVAALWWVVGAGHAGFAAEDRGVVLTGLALLLVSGTSITISLLYSKRLHDIGIGAETVTAIRYPLIVIVAGLMIALGGRPIAIEGAGELVGISLAAAALIVLPLYVLQAGIARTGALTAQVMRSLGPVCVFALEQFDERIQYAPGVLICILAYSFFAIAANLVHGWHGVRTARATSPRRATG